MNNWEIIDNNGVIHSGTEEEMIKAFEFMTNDLAALKEKWKGTYTMREIRNLCLEYGIEWKGDLKLVQVHNIWK